MSYLIDRRAACALRIFSNLFDNFSEYNIRCHGSLVLNPIGNKILIKLMRILEINNRRAARASAIT